MDTGTTWAVVIATVALLMAGRVAALLDKRDDDE